MAYFPVNVLDNAIKAMPTVKAISNTPIATFDTDISDRLVNLEVAITATQSGSGTPSPSNPRTINGFSACNLSVNGTTETIPFGQTVYGGRLNVGSGVLTVTHGYTTINDCIASRTTSYVNPVFYGSITGLKPITANVICEDFNAISGKPSASSFSNASNNYDFAINSANTGSSIQVFLRCDEYSDVTSLKNAVGSSLVIYELASETVIQLDSNEVASIVGNNNIYADTGDIIDLKYQISVGQAIS